MKNLLPKNLSFAEAILFGALAIFFALSITANTTGLLSTPSRQRKEPAAFPANSFFLLRVPLLRAPKTHGLPHISRHPVSTPQDAVVVAPKREHSLPPKLHTQLAHLKERAHTRLPEPP